MQYVKLVFFQNFPRTDVEGSLLQYFNYHLRHELFCSISFGRIIFLPLVFISAKPSTYFCETYSDMVSLMSILEFFDDCLQKINASMKKAKMKVFQGA